MKVECLASSSNGNCFIFEFVIDGDVTRIMVECGISMRDIYFKLNERKIMLSSIKACLITHAHSDHCKSATNLKDLGLAIFASKSTLEKINCKGNELLPLKPNRVLNGLYVMPFEVEHDIEGAIGFIIKTREECVIFINDHKKWNANLYSFKPDYVFIECNYDHKTVYAQLYDLKKKANPTQEERNKIKQHERNLNAHCSLHGTLYGLGKLNLINCKAIFLMHLSDRYANEYKMKNAIRDRFGIQTYVCKKDGGIK